MTIPTLNVFSGLPGVGKTTVSQRLASRLAIPHLRIDTIEQALRDLAAIDVQGEGYRPAYRIAADNLRLGVRVVADSCNPIELTRIEWENVARAFQARHVDIEVLCSDRLEHRERFELRQRTASESACPGWKEVESREYDSWRKERIVIDTAKKTAATCFDELVMKLAQHDA